MGWRVGLYTSPHLVSFRERMRVDGVPISEDAVAMWTARLRPLIEEHGATFFEATTAIAFADFAARGAEIAVVEVGLGGRLDSTNVVQPLVSVVTKIELDHVKYLGDTLELIAGEKAGIAKPGAPFVIGERGRSWSTCCAARASGTSARSMPGAQLDVRVGARRTREWKGPLRLEGPHQRRNAAVALAALEALPGAPGGPMRVRSERASPTRSIAGPARPAGPVALRRGAQSRRDARPGRGARRAASARGRSTPWSRSWATRTGRRCWCSLDAAVDRGVLTVAPTAAGRGWDLSGCERWLARPVAGRPRACSGRSSPTSAGRVERGAAGGGDRAGDRLVPHGG